MLLLVGGIVAVAAVVGVLSGGDIPPDPPRTAGLRFAKGQVEGTDTTKVTTVRFGPDGRLYVGQQTGIIRALTL